jgi:Tfp pilus assembly protein PilV
MKVAANNQNGFTLVEAVVGLLVIIIVAGWIMNFYKLSQCDFEAPYKAEVIHGVGIVPIVGMVTGWLDVGV